jgi:predicted nucleic acid-binding protein
MRKLKLYLETSVWNFCFADDAPEKQAATLQFFELVKQEAYDIFVSNLVFQEIADAPARKRELLLHLTTQYRYEELEINQAVLQLTNQYLAHGALPVTAEIDATHAAVATVYELDALISWNLKHLANLNKMIKLNVVNLACGYTKKLELITPLEVVNHD